MFQRLVNIDGKVNDQNLESVQTLCRCWDNYRTAIDQLNKDGLVVVTSTGNYRKHPAYDIAKTSMEGFVRLSKLLDLYENVQKEIESELDSMVQ